MRNVARWFVQLLAYGAFVALLGYLSFLPTYRYTSGELATIKLSFSHATERVEPCVRLSPEEVAELAPNMRQAEVCERERLPMTVELEVDGELVANVQASPTGVWSDGPASVYQRLEIAAGERTITARLRDSAREEGWDYTHTEEVALRPGRIVAVTFDAATGGFRFR